MAIAAYRSLSLGSLGLGAVALGVLACRDPTEITLVLQTDVPCDSLQGVAVATGTGGNAETALPSTVTTACLPDGGIGTLVLVPADVSETTNAISVRVVAGDGQSVNTCSAPLYGPGCIVARRTIRYVPHTPLVLPIELRGSCRGVLCAVDETCVMGVCKNSYVDCTGPCSEGDLDGGTPLPPPPPPPSVFCGDMSAYQAGAMWPGDGYCPTHQSRSPYLGAMTNKLRWKTTVSSMNQALSGPPAIASDGTIYVGSNDRSVHALDPSDGHEKGHFATGGNINTVVPAIAADGTLYFGSSDGNLYAVAPDLVQMKWKVQALEMIEASFSLKPGGSVGYVGAGQDQLWAVDLADAGIVGTAPADGLRSPAVGPSGTVYTGSPSGLYTFDSNLHPGWTFPINGGVLGNPTLAGDAGGNETTVYAASPSMLYAIDIATHSMRWQFPIPGYTGATPAIGPDGTVYVTTLDLIGTSSILFAIAPNGTQSFSPPTLPGIAYRAPVIGADGTIYIGVGSIFYALARSDGHKVWSSPPLDSTINCGSAIAKDGTVYIGTNNGTLYAFGPR